MAKENILDTVLAQIRETYQTCPFLQIRLLSVDRFVRYLRDRALHFRKEDLQDFKDILLPVQVSEDSQGSLYHPYQVWLAYKLVQAVSPNLVWSSWWTATPESLNRFIATYRQRTAKSLQVLAARAVEFYQLLALLVAADPYCIPDIRGKVSLPIWGPDKNNYSEYVAWRGSFDGKGIVTGSTLAVDQIKEWHRGLSVDAGIVNDAENWYLLMRHATFDKRDRLKGRSRLAFDFYEMAESLRILLKLAGEKVPAEDDYFGGGGDWKIKFYDAEEINFAQRTTLKRIAREYGLDASYRGFWFVEGPTEAGFVQAFSEGSDVNMEERGIALGNLGGVGDLVQKRTEVAKRLRGAQSFVEQLRSLKADEVFAFITVDDDEGISEGLESLRKQGLLTAGFVKWQGDFEEANFTFAELIQVLV